MILINNNTDKYELNRIICFYIALDSSRNHKQAPNFCCINYFLIKLLLN